MDSPLPSLVPLTRKGTLPCPECSKILSPFKCDNVVVDMCGECNGIWFDHREIGVFRRALSRFDYSQLQLDRPAPGLASYQIFTCPRCQEVLSEATYGYNSGVHVHTCLRCRGLWVPLIEVVNLIGLAKLGQDLAPDLRGALREIKALDSENRRFLWLQDFADWLMTKVRNY